jgi:hypothetical protein
MRNFAGKILIRVPENIHKELAKEAFQTGRSINQLCLAAILARKALKRYDPWKAIEEIWKANRRVDERQLEKDIRQAIADVRHAA